MNYSFSIELKLEKWRNPNEPSGYYIEIFQTGWATLFANFFGKPILNDMPIIMTTIL